MPGVLHVVKVIGVVDNALNINLIVSHTHAQLKVVSLYFCHIPVI